MAHRTIPIIVAALSASCTPTRTTVETASARESWDALCPAEAGAASEPRSIVAHDVLDLEFEPSGAAVVGDRVAIVGDKQTALWWWKPTLPLGDGSIELTHDPSWAATPIPLVDARSCCVDVAHAAWGTTIKREKAGETCDAHRVARGASVPWLKGEALASTTDGVVYVGGNMGFDCVENEVRRIDIEGKRTTRPVPGVERARVLEALGASDVRVEGFAITRDGAKDLALVGVRQVTMNADPDSRDVTMTRKVVLFERAAQAQPFSLVGVVDVDVDAPDASFGLSDLAVLEDGRVAVSVSVEKTVDGVHHVGGTLLITDEAHPWRNRAQTTWRARKVTSFDDHKPEGVTALSATCLLVVFDDDEKVKKQMRERLGAANANENAWASRAAFARFVRIPL